MGLEPEEPGGSVICAAIEVHKVLRPGFLERVYQNALELKLAARDIRFDTGREHRLIFNFAKPTLGVIGPTTARFERYLVVERLAHDG